MTMLDDDQLVEGIRSGDKSCCNQLVKKYWNEFNFLARRLVVDHAEANDIVQDAFINAIKHINSFENTTANEGALRAWLRKIVTNQALMALRKKKSRKEESLDELMLDFDDSGHHVHHFHEKPVGLDVLEESRQVREQVRKAIDSLPETFRVTLILRDIEGYTGKEVAVITQTTEENVKVRLHRARLALRNLLSPALRESE